MNELSKTATTTIQHIADTFFEMYKEISLERITMSALSKNAHLHRSTVYKYFSDVYAILDFIEEDILSSYLLELKTQGLLVPGGFSAEKIPQILSIYTKYTDRAYYLVNKSSTFKTRLFETMKPVFLTFTGIDKNVPHYDFLSGFVFSTLVYSLNFWHENQDWYSLEEVHAILMKLVGNQILQHTSRFLPV